MNRNMSMFRFAPTAAEQSANHSPAHVFGFGFHFSCQDTAFFELYRSPCMSKKRKQDVEPVKFFSSLYPFALLVIVSLSRRLASPNLSKTAASDICK